MYTQASTEERIGRHLDNVLPDIKYAIYGDPAYTLTNHVYKPYVNATATSKLPFL